MAKRDKDHYEAAKAARVWLWERADALRSKRLVRGDNRGYVILEAVRMGGRRALAAELARQAIKRGDDITRNPKPSTREQFLAATLRKMGGRGQIRLFTDVFTGHIGSVQRDGTYDRVRPLDDMPYPDGTSLPQDGPEVAPFVCFKGGRWFGAAVLVSVWDLPIKAIEAPPAQRAPETGNLYQGGSYAQGETAPQQQL